MAEPGARGRPPSGQIRKEQSTEAGHAVADCSAVVMTPGNAGRAKGTGYPGLDGGQLPKQEEPPAKPRPKPFAISKQVVWEAYRRVKANDGAGGVDGQSLQEFEQELKNNLYKLWLCRAQDYAEQVAIAACSPLPDPRAGVKYSA